MPQFPPTNTGSERSKTPCIPPIKLPHLSPRGSKLKWIAPDPTSVWSRLDVPPLRNRSQKLISDPATQQDVNVVFFKATE